jgi:hypothetical protein
VPIHYQLSFIYASNVKDKVDPSIKIARDNIVETESEVAELLLGPDG